MYFKLFGIKFEISYIFLCVATVFIATDKTGIYIALLISVLVHEVAHIITLISFKIRIKAVRLIIGCIGIEYVDTSNRKERLLSLLAGPLSNILLSLLGYCLKSPTFFAVNLILAVYNLLPVRGLDGGSILEVALSGIVSKSKTDLILNVIVVLFSSVLLVYFIFSCCCGIRNYSVLLLCIYLITPLIIKKFVER